jgi:hypothetical protein
MKRLLAVLAALCLAGSAHAFAVSSMQIQPGFFTAGVRIFCSGNIDTTLTTTCQLYVRMNGRGDGEWYLGTRAFRRVGYTNAFDGILIGLESGLSYTVRATITNGTEVANTNNLTFTTRSYTFSVTGPMVYVAPATSTPAGVDGGPATAINTTCTAAAPCLTIHHADSVLVGLIGTIPNQGRGGAIILRPGVYRSVPATYNAFLIGHAGGSATPDNMYHLMSDGTNPDSTIIDCTEERQLTWAARPTPGVVLDSCYKATYTSACLFSEDGATSTR